MVILLLILNPMGPTCIEQEKHAYLVIQGVFNCINCLCMIIQMTS